MQEITLKTDRRTQLIEITELVREALGETNGAAAALAICAELAAPELTIRAV